MRWDKMCVGSYPRVWESCSDAAGSREKSSRYYWASAVDVLAETTVARWTKTHASSSSTWWWGRAAFTLLQLKSVSPDCFISSLPVFACRLSAGKYWSPVFVPVQSSVFYHVLLTLSLIVERPLRDAMEFDRIYLYKTLSVWSTFARSCSWRPPKLIPAISSPGLCQILPVLLPALAIEPHPPQRLSILRKSNRLDGVTTE